MQGIYTNTCPVMPSIRSDQSPIPKTTLQKVVGMVNDKATQMIASDKGLCVQAVAWEDTARFKDSCFGPNISDMTLQVKDEHGNYKLMPLIRRPNFSDSTVDRSIDSFSALVGNEKGDDILTRLTLRQYLDEISKYIHDGNIKGSLLCDRDAQVIQSVQACFLPAEEGKEVNFNVALFNYQSHQSNPAVLTIILSSKGASAQIIDNGDDFGGQKLMFDKKNRCCDFVAERLKDVRANAGQTVEGALSLSEEDNRRLHIVQIPLKVTVRHRQMYAMSFNSKECCTEKCVKSANIDFAQLKIGKELGDFGGLKGLTLERDPQYPIRVTTQLYYITDDGNINREQMNSIAEQIEHEKKLGHNESSLVIENTKRQTEWQKV